MAAFVIAQKNITLIFERCVTHISIFMLVMDNDIWYNKTRLGGNDMERATVSEIAAMTGLHENTIRRYADRGIVDSKRDFRGWRFFPEPQKTVKRIRGLLDGEIQLEES